MCTIALAWQVLADAPLAIAANRDEAVDRESRPPQVLDRDPDVLAPQDAVAGGTWIGVSERGLVVAITNRWTEPPEPGDDGSDASDADRRSRGLLVRDALASDDADAALDFVREAVERDRYAGFNLLLADAERAVYLEWDGQPDGSDPAEEATDAPALRVRNLEPGVHAIVNPGLDDADERAVRVRAELVVEGAAPGAAAWLDGAAHVLRDHEFDVCVHGDGFGTRSSSLVRVGLDGGAAYAFADGPPCETSYEHVTAAATFVEESF